MNLERDLELIGAALYTGQKSAAKTIAQEAFRRVCAELQERERLSCEEQQWKTLREWLAVEPYSGPFPGGGREFKLTMERGDDDDGLPPQFALCAFRDGVVIAGFNGDTLWLASEWCAAQMRVEEKSNVS